MSEPEQNPKMVDTFYGMSNPIPKELYLDKPTLAEYLKKFLFPSVDEMIEARGHKRDGEFKQDFAGYFSLELDTDGIDPDNFSNIGEVPLKEVPIIDPITQDWDHARIRFACRTLRKDVHEAKEKQDGEWHDV